MISKRRLLEGSCLYAILDKDFSGKRNISKICKSALSGGASLIQLRDKYSSAKEMIKTAKTLKAMARKHKALFIVNDRLDVALAVGADGVHIGQGDLDVSIARRLMGRDAVIGVSVGSVKEAKRAKAEGASYIGAGPIFKTPIKGSKPAKGIKLLARLKGIGIPTFAIGGINRKNIRSLTSKGFNKVAVIRDICKASDAFLAACRLREALALT